MGKPQHTNSMDVVRSLRDRALEGLDRVDEVRASAGRKTLDQDVEMVEDRKSNIAMKTAMFEVAEGNLSQRVIRNEMKAKELTAK